MSTVKGPVTEAGRELLSEPTLASLEWVLAIEAEARAAAVADCEAVRASEAWLQARVREMLTREEAAAAVAPYVEALRNLQDPWAEDHDEAHGCLPGECPWLVARALLSAPSPVREPEGPKDVGAGRTKKWSEIRRRLTERPADEVDG